MAITPTAYFLSCPECGGRLKEICVAKDGSQHTYCCIAKGHIVSYTGVYVHRFIPVDGSDGNSAIPNRPPIPERCPSCGQPANEKFAPRGANMIECSVCGAKLVYDESTNTWQPIE